MSDPDHHRYGEHLTSDEVNDLVKPGDDSVVLVHEWLRDHGIDEDRLNYSPAKDWMKVQLPVARVERLLDTKYALYKHVDGTHIIRASTWSLPTHLHKHIDTIQPTNSFFHPTPRKSNVMPVAHDGQRISSLSAVQRMKAINSSHDLAVA